MTAVTETLNDGLKREYKVTLLDDEIQFNVARKLEFIGKSAKLPGFRAGKIPMPVLKQRYGNDVRNEILAQMAQMKMQKVCQEKNIKPVLPPKISIPEYTEGQDLDFTVALETTPEIPEVDFSAITLKKYKVVAEDTDIEKSLSRLAKSRRDTADAEDGHVAAMGDILVIDFEGRVDGETRDGMKAQGYSLELGSGSFIDTFEEQLVGLKAGESKTINVTFPDGYHEQTLAGQPAEFDVTVEKILTVTVPVLDDELAKNFGEESLDGLKTRIKDDLENQFLSLSRDLLKKYLFDKLASSVSVDLPESMVDNEFSTIWTHMQKEIEDGRIDMEKEGKTEDDLRKEFMTIAKRRVRLGLYLTEYGDQQGVKISEEDLNKGLLNIARQYGTNAQEVLSFYQKNEESRENIRTKMFEERVVDLILEKVTLEEEEVPSSEFAKLEAAFEEAIPSDD